MYFARLLRACALALTKCSECNKTTVLVDRDTVLLGRNTCHKQRAQRENSQQIAPAAFQTRLSVPIAPNMRLGAHWARFGKGLRAFRVCLGGVLGPLREVLGPLGRLLGAF